MQHPKLHFRSIQKDLAGKLKRVKRVLRTGTDAEQAQTEAEFKVYGLDGLIGRLKWEFRHRHIALSELRGVPRSRIEKPADGNHPDEDAITAFRDEIEEAFADWKELKEAV